VGLGMQYLPEMIKDMSRAEVTRMMLFQAQIIFWAMAEQKILEPELAVLGIDPRETLERGRAKQIMAMREAFGVLGVDMDEERNPIISVMNGATEILFPTAENRDDRWGQIQAAWKALFVRYEADQEALDVHSSHEIRTARGGVAKPEKFLD